MAEGLSTSERRLSEQST
jgi:hypothetical protein